MHIFYRSFKQIIYWISLQKAHKPKKKKSKNKKKKIIIKKQEKSAIFRSLFRNNKASIKSSKTTDKSNKPKIPFSKCL